VIGWALELHPQASWRRCADDGDRGSSPSARRLDPSLRSGRPIRKDYTDILEDARHPAEHEPVGCPYDNAKAESFMKTLKNEEVDARTYRDIAEARSAVGTFLEQVYNRRRLHSALAYRPPVGI